jgi:hypothetical protein
LFDQWNLTACQHESGVLVNYYIGNTAMVGFLRQSLSRRSELFPLILSKIIYNGIHAGDFIAAADVCLFEPELRGLSDFHCDDPSDDERIRHFQKQLRELVQAAMALHKPISF